MSEEQDKTNEAGKKPERVISEEHLQSLLKKSTDAEGGKDASPMQLDDLALSAVAGAGGGSIDMLMDVTLNVRIELGRTHMSVEDILGMQGGSVVTLEKLAGDFVDVLVNEKLVARGEVLILNDHFCVRIAEIVSPEERQDATLR